MEHDIRSIYEQFLAGTCSREDLGRLLAHFDEDEDATVDQRIQDILAQEGPLSTAQLKAMEPVLQQNWEHIRRQLEVEKQRKSGRESLPPRDLGKVRPLYRYRVVASIAAVLLLSCSAILTWYLLGRDVSTDPLVNPDVALNKGYELDEDVAPGQERAILILADGRQILLDTLGEGVTLVADGLHIRKEADGTLSYEASHAAGASTDDVMHTVRTPKGTTFRIALPDGSIAWLNADASIQYPVAFASEQRLVSLTGEAYFDVREDRLRPFTVQAGEQEITVLGTEFNVSAYAGEQVSTTLVNGSVRVTQGKENMLLSPGQQARWDGKKFERRRVDVEPFVAWKNGWFIFHDLSLKEILPQIARWYDVEVDDRKLNQTNRLYYGEISRDVPLSTVLDMLAADGSVRFELKGGVLLVR